jgi:hypothetical protein
LKEFVYTMTAKNVLTEEFRTEELVIRGVTYKFRELSATEYDDIIKMAAGPDDNAELGTVLKLMASKCLLEPDLTPEQLGAKPYPVYNKILQTINKMHFGVDATEGDTPNS